VRVTNRSLQRYFKQFNKKYFGNTLDPHIKVRMRKIPGLLGLTDHAWFKRPATAEERKREGLNKTAICCYWVPRIFITEEFRQRPRLAICTLLHEMVHVDLEQKGHNNHSCTAGSKLFNDRMKKLARDGAFNGWW
jgi:hypothetical protein